ncbi:peptidoglycan bridge formation glycyltransferase FemA/FemB family protein [Labilibaculum sp.]|uniref:lipid II:glycine glycyltransferase FemX n=1 Tax=Labilibaculum sp. TaxID=2060723 RepID=UPI002AA6E08A|nr:peptidoglycan bridge formation glycyltransferase FemA/FemB family protein [Labilibaculum sp.]
MIFKRLVFTNESIKKGDFEDPNFLKEKNFLEEVVKNIKNTSAHFVYQPNTNVVFDTFPKGSLEASFGSYQIDLEKGEEELFANLHPKHRNVIKKAKKDGVIIKTGEDQFSDFFELYKDTMERQNLNYTSEIELKEIATKLNGNALISVAYKDGIPQGSSMLLYEKGFGAYYFYGGSALRPHIGSINLMHWENIIKLKSVGVSFYDFVGARIKPKKGSKIEGIQKFKERFGGEMKKGYLWKYPSNNVIYKLFCFVAKLNALMHKRVYKGDIIDQERL